MDLINTGVISLLQYLLPGFVTAWIFYAFTSYPKQSHFERVVQALIFTIIIQGLGFLFKALANVTGLHPGWIEWNTNTELLSALITSLLLGLVFAYFANNDKFHALMRKLAITRETSYASEWFSAFADNITYVVLHLDDGRRIYGWPSEWPTEPHSGHFLLREASWLDSENTEIPLSDVESILINGSAVVFVEFMKK